MVPYFVVLAPLDRNFKNDLLRERPMVLEMTGITSATLLASLFMGAIIGLVELFFVHADERGLGWLSHGLHALPVAMVLTFIAMHIHMVYPYVGLKNANAWVDVGLRVVLGLIAAFKVKSAAAVIQGHSNVGEKLSHALIVGALIAASPYIYAFLSTSGVLPSWLEATKTAAKTVR